MNGRSVLRTRKVVYLHSRKVRIEWRAIKMQRTEVWIITRRVGGTNIKKFVRDGKAISRERKEIYERSRH